VVDMKRKKKRIIIIVISLLIILLLIIGVYFYGLTKVSKTHEKVEFNIKSGTNTKEIINKYDFLSEDILNSDIYYPLEGYLFPDTYAFYKDASIETIIEKMLDKTKKVLDNSNASLSEKSIHEILTIASIIESDVQNLVVRNSNGDIISKGTMYINKVKGYAVINDFELNREYKKHELEKQTGRYNVEETSQDEQERELIFKAFQRGLRDFIEEYNNQNPNNPINQVNIGMGYNRLKKQVERFKKATSNLTVPNIYGFQDAMEYEQHILYKRTQRQMENEGYDR